MRRERYKLSILFLTLVVILGIYAATPTLGLAGQHNFYNTFLSGIQVPCEKCHQYVEDEFNQTPAGYPHKDLVCEGCHRHAISGTTYALGDAKVGTTGTFGTDTHAAQQMKCRSCHTAASGDTTNITNVNESHKPLFDAALDDDLDCRHNEACVPCHTGLDKNITFRRALYIEYDLVNPGGGYEIQNFTFVSTNDTTIKDKPSGTVHRVYNASDIDCFDCHPDVKSALENGGHVPRSDRETMGMPSSGHQGRHHNFDRSSVTIDSCRSCHLPDSANFGSGYTHPEAQLDYHAATTEHCYNCHYNGTGSAPGGGRCTACHDHLRSGFHDNILDNMFSQSFCMYQIDKVCIGCHLPGHPTGPGSFGNKHFKVYTEPSTTIIVE